MTKGPQALFYGGDVILPFLSNKSPGRHTIVTLIMFVLFHFCLLVYKKLVMRKVPPLVKLKEAVVNNFLNLYKTCAILLVSFILMLSLLYYHKTIQENSKDENLVASKHVSLASFKKLLMIATLETSFQAFPFLTNPALR